MRQCMMIATLLCVCVAALAGCGERLVIGTVSYSFADGPLPPGAAIAVAPEHDAASMHDWTIHKVHIESYLRCAGFSIVRSDANPALLCLASYSTSQQDGRPVPREPNAPSAETTAAPRERASTAARRHRFALRFVRNVQGNASDADTVAQIDVMSVDPNDKPDRMIALLTHLAFSGWPGEHGRYDAAVKP